MLVSLTCLALSTWPKVSSAMEMTRSSKIGPAADDGAPALPPWGSSAGGCLQATQAARYLPQTPTASGAPLKSPAQADPQVPQRSVHGICSAGSLSTKTTTFHLGPIRETNRQRQRKAPSTHLPQGEK